MQPKTIAGKIYLLGVHTFDKISYEYEVVEIKTDNGIVELSNVIVSTKVARCFTPGRKVALSYFHMKDRNGKPSTMILGAHEFDENRTYFDEGITKIRTGMAIGGVIQLLLVPVGLIFFVAPGLYFAWKAFDTFKKMRVSPSEDEIRSSVDSLAKKSHACSALEPVAV